MLPRYPHKLRIPVSSPWPTLMSVYCLPALSAVALSFQKVPQKQIMLSKDFVIPKLLIGAGLVAV